jgi:pyruvate formate lyase activating enzyme
VERRKTGGIQTKDLLPAGGDIVKIGGFQSVSLSDFPGTTTAIVFTQGCNFRCPFCHNADLLDINVPSSMLPTTEKILDSLKSRRKVLEGLVITGGEPTIQPDLFSFIIKVRNIGYKIKLDTNGSRPEMIDALIRKNVLDYIAMDIKAPLQKYNQLAGVQVATKDILKSIAIISKSNLTAEFRTTYVQTLLTQADIESIRSLIPKDSMYKVQRFISKNAREPTLREINDFGQSNTDFHGSNLPKSSSTYIY